MATIDASKVERIVQQVVERVRASDKQALPDTAGIYADVNQAVKAASIAALKLQDMTLAVREQIIRNIRQTIRDQARILSEEVVRETKLGRVEDKVVKHQLAADKAPGTEVLQAVAWTGDRGLTLVERAPYGIIGAITPCTNPTVTIFCNAIGMIAGGNTVVFNAHPLAKRVSAHTVALINEAVRKASGPADLVTCVAEPTIESAQALMHHPGVNLLVVTGGGAVVREAITSGKKAICAGPGNPPVVVDESADIDEAARGIIRGASFDNNILCTDEKEIFCVAAVADKLMAALKEQGAFEIASWQLNRLLKVLLQEDRGPGEQSLVNKNWVGRDANLLLKEIGIRADSDVRLVVSEVDNPRHQLVWTEQLLPVIPLVRVRSAEEAISLALEAEHGFRHTAVMYSKNLDNLSRMARQFGGSIFVKNGPSLSGLGYGGEGFTSFTIASPTGEGLTSAHDFTRVRRCTLVDSFRIV
ncbi:MAG: aldehyde dehydrogenase family protein [Anaerolineae bacterium]